MHQQPRAPPRTASSANNLQTNPSRTNNSRNPPSSPTTAESYPYNDRDQEDDDGDAFGGEVTQSEAERNHQLRVRQIIQQFFCKAALMIISSRASLEKTYTQKGELKQNKWFNIVMNDTEELSDHLAPWKRLDLSFRPPPMCIEVYLDLRDLSSNQILVASDQSGKRSDVAEILNRQTDYGTGRPGTRSGSSTQIILERWTVEVKDPTGGVNNSLPIVYKRAVLLFRSLWSVSHVLPAWQYRKSLTKQTSQHTPLKLRYRISNDEFKHPRMDTLHLPFFDPSQPTTETYEFTPEKSPIGPLSISVVHRTSCELRVEDSEALLSSQFMGLDDNYFTPSLGGATSDRSAIPGSLPVGRPSESREVDRGQAYGSLSSFHQAAPPASSSPISALRAARESTAQTPSDDGIAPRLLPSPRVSMERKPSLRSGEGGVTHRRPSVSFQPFKAGSLSSSPAMTPALYSPSGSLPRTTAANPLTQPRNRTSLTTLPQAALRTPSLPNETAIASSASSSPKPAPISRYSSSFGHRRSRFSSGGGSKVEEDNASSGKASVASSAPPGSGMLNEGDGGSSGSIRSDDDNISDFLKLLDAKKDLKSLNRRDSASRDASMRKTTAALSRYQRMRDSNAALSDSMSSSLMGQRSSSSSSRQLSSVPPMIAGTSVSTSSSPGKPISPHTPHTPAIPSRLSANSIVEYDQPRRSRSTNQRGRNAPASRSDQMPPEEDDEDRHSSATGATTAIPIPTSPRAWPYPRRSSSAAQQQRSLDDDYGLRSASVPVDERPENLSLSELVRLQEPHGTESVGNSHGEDDEHSALPPLDLDRDRDSPSTSRPDSQDDSRSTVRAALPLRSRPAAGRGTTSGRSRYSFSSRVQPEDDEPLLFYMSEIGAMSRRSAEGSGSGSGSGSGTRDERRRGGGGSSRGSDNRLGGDW